MDLKKLYASRFNAKTDEGILYRKNAIWKVLCKEFFSYYVKNGDTVVDIGAGYCEFINNIHPLKDERERERERERDIYIYKFAVDLNQDTIFFADKDVTVISEDCMNIKNMNNKSSDVIFMSNFLEHIQDRQNILQLFTECRRILKEKNSYLLILQPNIKYVGMAYYDFFDHYTALTDKSLTEALELCGFKIVRCIPRFLPYTTKSALPQAPWLVSLYLKIPFAWRFFGKQCFVAASPN